VLREWDKQSTAAERLCADLLRLEGFEGVDPQSPIGGPDGGKDLLCEKGGVTFVAACYFPHEQLVFSASRNKFAADLGSSLKHKRDGFIFMTNQQLSPGERTELEKAAALEGKRPHFSPRVSSGHPGFSEWLRPSTAALADSTQ
jgi:hypothetical protein